ncbi:MAG: xanthine dehydrogenase family protein molybdopterin-binding subunit [Rubellimicrobium sp.]|nr:xanthine dehydrogenase family protein molybdopterin-binding subunit [Rubellimicrobium sp.]
MKDHVTNSATISRRGFVVSMLGAGGALVIGSLQSQAAEIGSTPWEGPVAEGAQQFTPWIAIQPDGKVIVYVTHPDIGNGPVTQAVSYIYEELAPRWDDLQAEYASPNRNYRLDNVYSNVGGPLAYFSGRSTSEPRRTAYMTAAAGARERLKAAAGAAWGVDPAAITVAEGRLAHAESGNDAPFTDFLAAAAAITLDPEPQPKPREEWTFLGKQAPGKIQLPLIVRGQATYGIDVRLPDMVYAALRQSPVMGGRLKSFDFDAIRDMPGVRAAVEVVPNDPGEPNKVEPPFPFGMAPLTSAVAVIADHYWQARTALDALPIEWDDGPGTKWADIEMMNQAAMAAVSGDEEGNVLFSVGDVEAELARGGTVVEAEYLTPYCDHVNMEPLNSTAIVTDDRVEIWHPGQHTQMAWAMAVQQTGVAPENVEAHQTFVGGGFGRRVFSEDARMGVAVAQQYPGVPVHTIWSREESMRQGRYKPLMAARLRARLGDDGLPTALHVRVAGGPGFWTLGVADQALPLVIDNVQVDAVTVSDFHILTGSYRGPGYNSATFFLESFVDEMAQAAGQDPLDYRIALYSKWADEGWVKVLEELRDKSHWGEPLPAGQARGVAIGNWGMGGRANAGTTCGAVVHAEVDAEGRIRLHGIDVAFDSGRVMNRDAVKAQLEGGVIMGLNMAMNEKITVQNGRVVEGNYDQYPMLRIGDIPDIRIHFGGLTDDDRYDEMGEPPMGPVGPALANAVFAITGKRMRTQPFREHDLSWGGAA